MVWRNAGGICERKTLFQIKKETDQARFKGTRTGPMTLNFSYNIMSIAKNSMSSQNKFKYKYIDAKFI